MITAKFWSFGNLANGRVVTSHNGWQVVNSRNPYGSHNLVLVDGEGRAIRHGNQAVLKFLWAWELDHAFRRAARFLISKGTKP